MSSEILRIVVTGGVGAGKTTFIQTISEIDVVDTDKRATDELAEFKEKTTVALGLRKTNNRIQSIITFIRYSRTRTI